MPATLKQVYSAAKFVNSVNNGPWGQALVAELIPYLERQYRMDGKPSGRQRQPAELRYSAPFTLTTGKIEPGYTDFSRDRPIGRSG